MSVDALLAHLEAVQKTGAGRWKACCPAHISKSGASLTIRELDDGRVLLHDFGGCSVGDVLAAVGLPMAALYPERPGAGMFNNLGRPEPRPFAAHDVLRAIAFEVTVARLCSATMRSGEALSDEDDARLGIAMSRLMAAEEIANGR